MAEEENRKKMKEIMHDCMIAERTVSNCTYRASSSSFKSALLLCSASMSSISLPPPSPAMLSEEQNTKNYREVMKIKRKEVISYSIIDFIRHFSSHPPLFSPLWIALYSFLSTSCFGSASFSCLLTRLRDP